MSKTFHVVANAISPNPLTVRWELSENSQPGHSRARVTSLKNEDGLEIGLGDDPHDYITQICDIAEEIANAREPYATQALETSFVLEDD